MKCDDCAGDLADHDRSPYGASEAPKFFCLACWYIRFQTKTLPVSLSPDLLAAALDEFAGEGVSFTNELPTSIARPRGERR
jgi:hypothetical protein